VGLRTSKGSPSCTHFNLLKCRSCAKLLNILHVTVPLYNIELLFNNSALTNGLVDLLGLVDPSRYGSSTVE